MSTKRANKIYQRTKDELNRYARAARNRALRTLATAWVRSRVHRIKTKEAIELVNSRGLKTVNGSWHFTWDIERFFDEMYLYENGHQQYVFHSEPFNPWAPAPLFTNDASFDRLIARLGKNCPYWLLKLTSFDEFLARRSELSSQPTKNFPTRQTYPRYARKIRCQLQRMPFQGNEELFCKHYNQWKESKYGHSGEHILKQYFRFHDHVPSEWLFLHSLRDIDSNACRGICFVIEDGQSCSIFNLASESGHGRFMVVELIKECCRLGYSTIDCGVTETYGNYKSVVFLDRMETEDSGIPSFLSKVHLS